MAFINTDDTYIYYQYIIKEFFILLNGENIRISNERIGNIKIVNDYIENLFPIMSITLNLDAQLYYKIIKNKEDIKFKLRMQKFYRKNMDTQICGLYEDCIDNTFSLILDDEDEDLTEKLRELTYGEDQQNNMTATKINMEFFLFDSNLMKNMKQTVDKIIEDGTVTSAIGYLCSRLNIKNLLMTRADNVEIYKQMIIPPLKLSKALSYIDTFYGIHKSGSIIFFDYDRGYIIPYSGRCSAYENNEVKEVTILVPKSESVQTNNVCQLKKYDQPNNKMIIADHTSIGFLDETVSKDILDGKEVRIIDLYTGEIEDTLDDDEKGRRRIITNRGENKYFKDIYKAQMKSLETVITATFQDIDLTLIKPNKKFSFIFEDITLSRKYRGTYILAKSSMVLTRKTNEYTMIMNCVFRKSPD